ncbi:hypothetical protein NHN26_15935 [Rhodovulum tesquicola]|uniref:hypothetical protein n=1 Tax=Rhodovulum tesquicola TaxID=540254 RepID=UPI002096C1A1|nr:hypothetical protein [Rhodovulum tesquicola]MCO8146703.1 hypothetical protein [Rhodovulum tesquicola]
MLIIATVILMIASALYLAFAVNVNVSLFFDEDEIAPGQPDHGLHALTLAAATLAALVIVLLTKAANGPMATILAADWYWENLEAGEAAPYVLQFPDALDFWRFLPTTLQLYHSDPVALVQGAFGFPIVLSAYLAAAAAFLAVRAAKQCRRDGADLRRSHFLFLGTVCFLLNIGIMFLIAFLLPYLVASAIWLITYVLNLLFWGFIIAVGGLMILLMPLGRGGLRD